MQEIFGSCNEKYYFGIIERIWHNYSIHEQCNYGSLLLILSEVKQINQLLFPLKLSENRRVFCIIFREIE